MQKTIIGLVFIFVFTACNSNTAEKNSLADDKIVIGNLLDSFNIAAAKADYNKYFNYYTDDATFIGTDATEVWNKDEFMIWAKPAFDKGAAWNFKSLDRHIYFDKTGNLAWFDELLSTQMKLCRGSGVLVKQGDEWKVQQYVLSMTVPNNMIDSVLPLKAPVEDSIIQSLLSK